MTSSKEKLSILFGGLTLLIFASTPYVIDLIEPAKSIGQLIGENAKNLIDGLNGEKQVASNSKRGIWLNILTILGFISFAASITLSISGLKNSTKKWYAIPGVLLSIVGISIYFTHLAVGLLALAVLAILVVVVVLSINSL